MSIARNTRAQTRARRTTAKTPSVKQHKIQLAESTWSLLLDSIETECDELEMRMTKEIDSRFKDDHDMHAKLEHFNTHCFPSLIGPDGLDRTAQRKKRALMVRFMKIDANYKTWHAYYDALNAFNGDGALLSSIPVNMPFRIKTANTLYHVVRHDNEHMRGDIQIKTPYISTIRDLVCGVFAGSVNVDGNREKDMPVHWMQAGKRLHITLFSSDDIKEMITSPVFAFYPYLGEVNTEHADKQCK